MGGTAGSRTAGKREASAVQYSRLNDFRMEHIMLGGAESPGSGAPVTGLPRWRQQVQYAIGHTLNDFYSLQPEVRRETPVQFLLERRWPPKGDAFPSLMHYWEVKTAIADELMRMVSVNHMQEVPVLLYEQWHVPVPVLDIELAMIFQLAWNSAVPGRCLSIQKFMVNGNEEVITGFLHMANVFCHQAYGMPAETVEVYSLLDGRKAIFDGAGIPLTESLDYVRLLSVFLGREESSARLQKYGERRNDQDELAHRGYGLM
ncbi:hypothetical protein [Paenibacillus sp. S150]|uniref:hypothetical protein n=1 Tax=Paenibacillus sp. S150 TaxID=2749826 RepID=UPI001C5A1CB7|nr:hypothetical protein [Paenibacillus sp. S150]MBW4082959.1 hypothetical protein [Paenibacillus sp. S150]